MRDFYSGDPKGSVVSEKEGGGNFVKNKINTKDEADNGGALGEGEAAGRAGPQIKKQQE